MEVVISSVDDNIEEVFVLSGVVISLVDDENEVGLDTKVEYADVG